MSATPPSERPFTSDAKRSSEPETSETSDLQADPSHTQTGSRPTARRPDWKHQGSNPSRTEQLRNAIDSTDPLKRLGSGHQRSQDSPGRRVVKHAATEAVRHGRKALAGATGGSSEVAIRGGRFLLKYVLPLIPVVIVGILVFAAFAGTGSTADPLPYLADAASPDQIPEPYLNAYKSAGERFQIPWTVLAGVGRVASNHGRSAPTDLDDWGASLDRADGSVGNSALGPVGTPVAGGRHAPPPGTLLTVSSDHVTRDALDPHIPDYRISTVASTPTDRLSDLLAGLAAQGTEVAVIDVGFTDVGTGVPGEELDATLRAAATDGTALLCQIWLTPDTLELPAGVTELPNLTAVPVHPGVSGTATRVAEAVNNCVVSEPNSSQQNSAPAPETSGDGNRPKIDWDGPIGVYLCGSEGWCGPSPRIGKTPDEPQGPLALDPQWLIDNGIGGDMNDVAHAADTLASALAQIQKDMLAADTANVYADWQTNVATARMLWQSILRQAPVVLPSSVVSAPPVSPCDTPAEPDSSTSTTVETGESTDTPDACSQPAGALPAGERPVIPVAGVTGDDLYDSFGAPRSGGRSHQGIDIFADRGTPVLAAVAGTVLDRFHGGIPCGDGTPNNAVTIAGDDGNRYWYAHLDSITVTAGTHVAAGTQLGTVGTTGNACTTSPHLHFSINETLPTVINPYPFLRYGVTVGAGQFALDAYSRALAFATYYGGIIPGDPDAGTFPITGLAGGGTLAGLTADQSEIAAIIGRYFPPEQVDNAVRIAKCESGLTPTASHRNTNGSTDWGLFQLNDGGTLQSLLRETGEDPTNIAKALDPDWSARAAALLWRKYGWAQWVCSWMPTDDAPGRTGIIGTVGDYHSTVPGPGDTSAQYAGYLAP